MTEQSSFKNLWAPLCFAGAMLIASGCTEKEVTLEKALRISSVDHLKYDDHDPVRIKGRQPRDFPVHGIDVSRYNKSINWQTVKQQRVDFVFIKATEGKDDRDRRFKEFWQAAGAARIPRSAYHFYYFCASPEDQAANYIRTVPKSESSLPPILDVEWNPKSPTCRKRPPASKVVNHLKRFLTRLERHYGQKPIIYTTVDFHADNLADGSLPGYQYWLRSVKAEPKYVYGKRPWTFWQYTGTGKIKGISGEVDINAFRGSRASWKTWLASNSR